MAVDTALTRRGVLTGAGAAAAGIATGAASASGESLAAAARPNILWLVSEDNGPYRGAYGDALARTPAIDRLAAQGIRYDRAYATSPVCAPSRFAIVTGTHAESCGPAQHMRASGRIPSFLRGFPEYLRAAGYYCTNNAKTDYNGPIDVARTWNASGTGAHWRNRPAGAPFFAVFNTDRTHESKLFGAAPGAVSPDEVRLPAYLPDAPAVRGDRAAYYDLVRRMDDAVGERIAELEAAGLAEDTIVFYYSDHGGVLPRSKRHCYEDGLRTALVVRVPERWRHLAPAGPGSVVTAPVSLVDLAPTALALAGVAAPAHLHGGAFLGPGRSASRSYAFSGRDRMDERYDLVRTVTDGRYRYIRNYAPHRPWGQHIAYAWQQKGYQAWEREHLAGRLSATRDRFFRPKPAEELYDLRADPDEVRDLAADPAYDAVRRRLREALAAHLLAVHDNGFVPEGAAAEGYEQSRRAGAYPIADVLALADRAAARDPADRGHFTARLGDGNEVVRYWAAQGLLMLGPAAAGAAAALAGRLSAETSPRVAVVVAEALAGLGQPGPAVAKLASIVDGSGNGRARLAALNALADVGSAATAALPAIRRLTGDGDDYLRRAARHLELTLTGRYQPGAVAP
jgi:arylsulfatase A-like enzyme